MKDDSIICADFLEVAPTLPARSFNLIIADPPYNLGKDFGVWKEAERASEWIQWTRLWLEQCYRLLSESGNIFVYGIHRHLCWVQCMMYEIGYLYRRQIIWHYDNGFGGYGRRNLRACYEPILWFTRTKNYIYHEIREPYKSTERLKHKITMKNGKAWQPHPDGRMAGDVWNFPVLAGRRFRHEKVDHPTQKPLSISRRLVAHFSDPGDTVLVPFAGSGTECLAAHLEGRGYRGFDLNPGYVDLARQRLDKDAVVT